MLLTHPVPLDFPNAIILAYNLFTLSILEKNASPRPAVEKQGTFEVRGIFLRKGVEQRRRRPLERVNEVRK